MRLFPYFFQNNQPSVSTKTGFAAPSLVLVITLGLIILFSGYVIITQKFLNSEPKTDQPVACTQEAKQCSDGSYVSRIGPKCEFAACPEASATPIGVDTSNWKTYRSEKYGFEMRYPISWSVFDDSKGFKNLATISFGEEGAEVRKFVFVVSCWQTDPTELFGFYSNTSRKESAITVGMVNTRMITIGKNFTVPLLKQDTYKFDINSPVYYYCGLQIKGEYSNETTEMLNSFSFFQGFDTMVNYIVKDFQQKKTYLIP